MRNGVWIGFGILLIVVALFIAASSSSQAPAQPADLVAFQTALHTTPTPLPAPSTTPSPVPLIHDPSNTDEIVRFVFRTPYDGLSLKSCCGRADSALLTVSGTPLNNVLIGVDGVVLTDGRRDYPTALAVVLASNGAGFNVVFRAVQTGRVNPWVDVTFFREGKAVVRFGNLGWGRDPSLPFIREIYLKPCADPTAPTPIPNPDQESIEQACY